MCMGYFADKILYCSCYNGEIISDIPNRLLIKYSKKTFGKWNKSIIKKNIKKIRILLSKKANYDSYIDINYIFHIILATYHDSYKLYVKTIIILNKFFSKYGYASFYKLWQNDFVDFEAKK